MSFELYIQQVVRSFGKSIFEIDRLMNRAVDRIMDWRRRDGNFVRVRLMKDLKVEYQRLGLSVMPFLKKNNSFGDRKIKDMVTIIDGLNLGVKELDQVEGEFLKAEHRLANLKGEMFRRKAINQKHAQALTDLASSADLRAKVSSQAEQRVSAAGKAMGADSTSVRVTSVPPKTPTSDPDGINLDVSDITGVKVNKKGNKK
ncbi:MAG: hypothetical protein HN353_05630 [Bdellovibrionales bacterium]|nr:hypothetical protein [Bdellovibrionales bacterium]MBT3525077.1 hypothetical protein [Bdellovibrionales bacterium]MBT7669783.1 hypothetical protein [Bdellovibrionales bacterium]MBT7767402.1 hypothetical protein [Bdellovibrionales bacterium]